ncbi:MAG TPA: hypothetical protein VJN64_16360 [Terriglobales bacterium]|nr:hypothetical protein [Terriglobales bacterium]
MARAKQELGRKDAKEHEWSFAADHADEAQIRDEQLGDGYGGWLLAVGYWLLARTDTRGKWQLANSNWQNTKPLKRRLLRPALKRWSSRVELSRP